MHHFRGQPVMARRTFAQFQVVSQLHPFLDQEMLLTVTYDLMPSYLDYCKALNLGLCLKSI